MDKIVKLKYYYGRINREDAQKILTQLHTARTGLYLLRDHTKSEGNFIISLVFNSRYKSQVIICLFYFKMNILKLL